ncbi:COP23 domain-containing protein [Alkalinema sp. FACHB-956]|uniref:COP23 domain-containing protein n=1 Tax=Alkalinema sp. FACHB-956 TaxID=2692768 RepID=UPI001F5494A6|nr:COP23 domain-containing protein [Alkalinema sp. FACHB-956]
MARLLSGFRFSQLGLSQLALGQLLLRGSSAAIATLLFTSGMAQAQTTPRSSLRSTGDVTVPTETVSTPSSSTPSSTTPTATTPSTNIPLTGVRFACQTLNGQQTVVYMPESQPTKMFPWAVPSQMGGGWSSDRRCAEIARRLESYRPDGLTEMMTAVENGYNTICVTTEKVPACRIVLTVPNGQDPIATRDRVFQNLAIADSGEMTQGVLTYGSKKNGGDILNQLGDLLGIPGVGKTAETATGNATPASKNAGINLRPFLDKADGGTGAKLSNGVNLPTPAAKPSTSAPKKPRSGLKLNPRIFR